MKWKFWEPEPEEVNPEYSAYLRAEEELQARQPKDGKPCPGWESWETIPGFKETHEAFLKEWREKNEQIKLEEATETCTGTRVRAWYTPSEVVYWGSLMGTIGREVK